MKIDTSSPCGKLQKLRKVSPSPVFSITTSHHKRHQPRAHVLPQVSLTQCIATVVSQAYTVYCYCGQLGITFYTGPFYSEDTAPYCTLVLCSSGEWSASHTQAPFIRKIGTEEHTADSGHRSVSQTQTTLLSPNVQ